MGRAGLAAVVLGLAMPGPAAAQGAISHGCPARAPQRIARPDWPAAQAQLAPGGATRAVICRYAGLNARPRLALTASAVLRSPAIVDALVWRLDTLAPALSGPVACPLDDGSQFLVRLRYPGGRVLPITVAPTGCGGVTNGAVQRTLFAAGPGSGPSLLAQLKRLARPPR